MNELEFIRDNFNRLHGKIDGIDDKMIDLSVKLINLESCTIESKSRIDIIENNYSHKIDWKNISGIVLVFCAIMSAFAAVAALNAKSTANTKVELLRQNNRK